MGTNKQIEHKRILVVEDELLIGLDLTDALFRAGAITFGPVTGFDDAAKLAELHDVDAAVLDFDIAGKEVTPLARYLAKRNIPFVVLTGNPTRAENAGLTDLAEIYEKPVSAMQLLERLGEMFSK